MITILKTNSEHPDFALLVRELDKDLAEKDGDEHWFFAQFNKIDAIKYVVLAYADGRAVGCGAIKEYEAGTMEVKRMFVAPEWRGKGIAGQLLVELERWAKELGYGRCILETGKKQLAAVRLYPKSGYTPMENYGQYKGVETSICFEKVLA